MNNPPAGTKLMGKPEFKSLEDLKNVIPHKWKPQTCRGDWNKSTLVAYIDSRQAMDTLDNVAGPMNWQNKFYRLDGTLYCRIGIKSGSEWIWKSDCGMPAKEQPPKSEASDAFKRAAVHWGIGRFLYSYGFIETGAVISNPEETRLDKRRSVPAPTILQLDQINKSGNSERYLRYAKPWFKNNDAINLWVKEVLKK